MCSYPNTVLFYIVCVLLTSHPFTCERNSCVLYVYVFHPRVSACVVNILEQQLAINHGANDINQ